MKLWTKILLVCVFGFLAGFASIYFTSSLSGSTTADAATKSNEKPVETDWNALRELDFTNGKASEKLKKLDGQIVRIPGFMIPLEDNQSLVSEFLLVPSPMACVHVPPPPPNQIVHVKMSTGQKTKMSYGPIWLQGRLHFAETQGPYGKSSFEVTGELTEPYQ